MLKFFSDYKDAFTSIGAIVAIAVFTFGLFQFWRAERWKKNEFLAKLYRDMIDDPGCQRAMIMMDWSGREIDFGSKDQPEKHACDRKLLYGALRTDNLSFTDVEAHIRDTFDRFFLFVSLFERAIRNRLVDEESVHPYFAYWIETLHGQRQLNKDLSYQIMKYVSEYGFGDVQEFLNRSWPKSNSSKKGASCGTVVSAS